MNATLLKALVEQQQQQAARQRYADVFNALESNYRDSMEKAYGLQSADDFRNEGGIGRALDVATSRILGLFPGRVDQGRTGMRNMNPILVQLLREKGFKDAFQGAREAEMQIPDESDPAGMLNFFDYVRQMGGIPYSASDKRINEAKANSVPKTDIRSIAEKYGY